MNMAASRVNQVAWAAITGQARNDESAVEG